MPHSRRTPYRVNGRDVWKAYSVEGWNMSFFGAPKLTFTCGNCLNVWATRNYSTLRIRKGGKKAGIVTPCTLCTELNFTNLIFD